jgi:hypothetical protein
MRLKLMIPKTRVWATISQLFFGHGLSFVFMALKGQKYALPEGFLNHFFYFRNTLKTDWRMETVLQFLLHVCFEQEKNSSPGASSRTCMIVLVTL